MTLLAACLWSCPEETPTRWTVDRAAAVLVFAAGAGFDLARNEAVHLVRAARQPVGRTNAALADATSSATQHPPR